ncbi:hypothetical protein D3C84_1237310 [compost metagenome]
MEEIWKVYGKFTPWQLREHSHLFPEWKRYEEKFKTSNSSYPVKLEDYFDSFDDGNGIFDQKDEYLMAIKEEYLENAG